MMKFKVSKFKENLHYSIFPTFNKYLVKYTQNINLTSS